MIYVPAAFILAGCMILVASIIEEYANGPGPIDQEDDDTV